MYQHPSDWHNNQGIVRQIEEQGMGIILMCPLTSGVFRRLMAGGGVRRLRDRHRLERALEVGRLLLNYVLSDPYVDVALVGDHIEPQAQQALTNLERILERQDPPGTKWSRSTAS
jgi:predicted aldo/keto reductase-like oxidoreductase